MTTSTWTHWLPSRIPVELVVLAAVVAVIVAPNIVAGLIVDSPRSSAIGVGAKGHDEPSFLHRLERLEAEADASRRRSEQLRADINRIDRRLDGDTASLGTAHRARRRVKRTLAGQLVAWERNGRYLRRARRYLRPGRAGDARMLLARAEPRVIHTHLDDIGALQSIETDLRRTRQLVGRRAGLTVQLAQSRGDAQAAETSRDRVVDDADDPAHRQEVDAELDRADNELQGSIGMMLKNDTARDFHRLKGTLLPPVSRPVSAPYGPREQDDSSSFVRHTGLTWTLPKGTPVKAVAGGLVVFAGRFEGFGKVVIIDHGQAYHTVYAHLDRLDVEVGKKLGRGALVGASGETGSLQGPQLYFELRKGGQPIDPTAWLIQR